MSREAWDALVAANESQRLALSLEQCDAIAETAAYLTAIEEQDDRLRAESADALTLLRWVSDCWQDGELRGDFDDCVDAIRAFLGDRPAAPGEGE